MSIQGLVHIKKALTNLNPENVRELASKPILVNIETEQAAEFDEIKRFLLGELKGPRRVQSEQSIVHGFRGSSKPADLVIYGGSGLVPVDGLIYTPGSSDRLIQKVLKQFPDLGVALARSFPPFRQPFVESVISSTAKENTLFSLTTALPDVIPTLIELPWAVAEFASDTAFLTMNQLKMAFLIAAASDREVGYRQQKSEIATVIASAFGWRALARQLVGKVPFGGGLVAKSAVAFAATRVLGLSLDRFYKVGYVYTRDEREELYSEAFQRGKTVAFRILSYVRPDLAAKLDKQQKSA